MSKKCVGLLLSAVKQHGIKQLHTTVVIRNTDLVENQLFASVNSPFVYTEFDVNYHRQAVGHPAQPVLGSSTHGNKIKSAKNTKFLGHDVVIFRK